MENMLDTEMSLAEVFAVIGKVDSRLINNRDLWWDWFCKDTALHNRGVVLIRKLKSLKNSTKFDKETTCVHFKNNCPISGPLYDEFIISDRKTLDVLYTISPCDDEGYASVWGKDNNFRKPLVRGSWKEVKEFFLA